MKRIPSILAALAAAVLVPACGPGNSSSSGSSGAPPAEAVAQTQRTDAASDAADKAVQITSEAVVDQGTDGQVAARGARTARSTVAFNYQASVDIVLDLDSVDGNGQDRWPHATGQVRIQAAGTLTGDQNAGTATYAVQTEWLTDGVFTDPVSGCSATIEQGSGIDYSLSIEWTYTAEDNWMISAEADASGQRTVVVQHDGQTWTITGQFTRHWEAVFTRAPGHFSVNVTAQGRREVTVTNGTETHTVVIDMAGLNSITIIVDGTVYGPYTAHQIRQYFNCNVE